MAMAQRASMHKARRWYVFLNRVIVRTRCKGRFCHTKSEKKKSNDFSQTLMLPKTELPMRANAAKREVQLYLERTTTNLYQWQQRRQQSDVDGTIKDFVLHDGPPHANGPPHMGHVLN